jgi:hypothetical protein
VAFYRCIIEVTNITVLHADIPNWFRRCSVKALATAILGSTPRSARILQRSILAGTKRDSSSIKFIIE